MAQNLCGFPQPEKVEVSDVTVCAVGAVDLPWIALQPMRDCFRAPKVSVRFVKERTARQLARAVARAEREEQRRSKARASYLANERHRWKCLPKKYRENHVRSKRDKRVPYAEEQGGFGTVSSYVAPVAAGAILGYAAHYLLQNTNKNLNAFESFFKDLTKRINDFTEMVKRTVGSLWVIPVALVAHALMRQFIDVPVLTTMSIALFAKVFGPTVWSHVSQYFEKKTQVEEQSAAGFCQISGLITTLFCVVCLPKRDVSYITGELLRRVGSFGRAREGFESLFETAIKYVEKLVNVVFRMTGKQEVEWIDRSTRLIDDFVARVDSFELLTRDSKNPVAIEELLQVSKLQAEALGLKMTVRTDSMRLRLERALSRLSVLLIPYQGAITAARNFRVEPQFLCFYGKSAVGKTSMVTKLATAILVKSGLCTPEVALRNLWQKGTTEYWNGYVNQKCLIMDDCFQVKPDKGETDNEYMNVIRMVGNWAYALNFADLESKGKFYFDTPLIIGTTNVADIRSQAGIVVNEPEAVVRRIKYAYEIVVNPEYQTEDASGRLDYSKVGAVFEANLDKLQSEGCKNPDDWLNAYPWEAWSLKEHNFSNPTCGSSAERTVSSLIAEVSEKLVKAERDHKRELSNLERMLNGLVSGENQVDSGVAEQAGASEGSDEPGVKGLISFRDLLDSNAGTEVASKLVSLRDLERRERDDGAKEAHANLLRDLRMGVSTLCSKLLSPWQRLGFFIGYTELDAQKGISKYLGMLRDAGLVLAAATLVKYASTIISRMLGKKVNEHSNVEGEKKTEPKKLFFKRKALEQAASKNDIPEIIYNNTYVMLVEGAFEEIHLGQMTFVDGHMALMPRHFRRNIETLKSSGGRIVFRHTMGTVTARMAISEFLGLSYVGCCERDVVFVKFPRAFLQGVRSIRKFFFTADKLQSVLYQKPVTGLWVADYKNVKGNRTVSQRVLTSSHMRYVDNLMTNGGKSLQLIETEAPTQKGDCGAPLVVLNARSYGAFCYLGQHVAGAPGVFCDKAYAAIVTQEDIDEARNILGTVIDSFGETVEEDAEFEDISPADGAVDQSGLRVGSFQIIGKVKPISFPRTSKLKLSEIGYDEVFGHDPRAPAVMGPKEKDGVTHYPMLKGLEAYSSPFEYKILPGARSVMDIAMLPFRKASVGDSRFVLSKEQAVAGVEGMKLKGICRSTSPGFPYSMRKGSGKKAYFGSEGPYVFDSEECSLVFARVDEIIANAKKNIRMAHIFTDFLKDELRPLEKVENMITRIISGAPLDYTIAFRMYFGAFMASFFRHHTVSSMSPGINPYSEWYMLASRLQSKGEKVFDGDFKRFDASEQPYVHWLILDVVNDWYDDGPENARIRSVLWLELVHSRHLGGNGLDQRFIYQWNKALPSGHPFTTIVNSAYALFTLVYCYKELKGDARTYWDDVYSSTFGDDNINNISDGVSDVFNQVTVAQTMLDVFDLTYTSGKKDGTLEPYSTLFECTFLKRTFVLDGACPGGWVAPLDLTSFLYTSYYYKNTRDKKKDTLGNLERSLGELSLHTSDLWDKYYPLFKMVYEEANEVPLYTTRQGFREHMEAQMDAWF